MFYIGMPRMELPHVRENIIFLSVNRKDVLQMFEHSYRTLIKEIKDLVSLKSRQQLFETVRTFLCFFRRPFLK